MAGLPLDLERIIECEHAMNVQIRAAISGDEKTLAALNAFVQEFHVMHNPSYFKPADIREVSAWFRELIGKPTVRIWIAEEGGKPVGYASVFLHDRPENPFCYARQWMEIDQVGVLPEYRRSGIGRRLVQHVVEAAGEEHIHDIELNSWCFNDGAHEAFRRLGFAPRIVRFGRGVSRTKE